MESALPPPVCIVLLYLLFHVQLYPRLVYFTLSSIFGGKKSALKYLVPHLKKYKERSDIDEEPVVFLELFFLHLTNY